MPDNYKRSSDRPSDSGDEDDEDDRKRHGASSHKESHFVGEGGEHGEPAAENHESTKESRVLSGHVEFVRDLRSVWPDAVDPTRRGDLQYDGHFVGAGEKTYSPASNFREIPAVEPNNGTEKTGVKILYINGILNNVHAEAESEQALANKTGASVVGLHNATEGWVQDLSQCARDKADFGKNPAVDSMTHVIEDSLKKGEPLNIVAHSHGALETSRALRHAERELISQGYSRESVEKAMHENVCVYTLGGAAETFPPGPEYHHVANLEDIVPTECGRGTALRGAADIPADLQIVREQRGTQGRNHAFNDFYVNYIDASKFKIGRGTALQGR